MTRTIALSLALVFSVEPPSPSEKWITMQAAEFSIFSNASEGETIALATKLLRMRDAVRAITMPRVRDTVPTNVFIFRDTASFAPYSNAFLTAGGAYVATAGYLFMGGKGANFILLNAASPAALDRLLYHQLAHFYVNKAVAGVPLWLHEGIAEFYSTFAMTADDINLGLPVGEHVAWLQSGQLIPLAQLFAIDEQSKEYNEVSREGVFYAESWAVVHYLLTNPERRGQLSKYLSLVDAGKPLDESFRTAFGTTLEGLEAEVRSYVGKNTFIGTRDSPNDLQAAAIPSAQPMSREEVLFHLGDLLARGSRSTTADAEGFLKEAVRANPNHAQAHGDLGLLHQRAGRDALAIAEYEKAVRLGVSEAWVYLHYGDLLIETSPREVEKARTLLRKAIELDPLAARAYAALGATHVPSREDPTPGIAALEKSLSLSPEQPDTAFDLVQLYLRKGRYDDAHRLTETVIASGDDPEFLAEARRAVLHAEFKSSGILAAMQRAEALIKNDKLPEAKAIYQAALAAKLSEPLKRVLRQSIADLEVVEGLQAVATLSSQGKFAEALAALDKVIPTITDPDMLASAKTMRQELEKAAEKQ